MPIRLASPHWPFRHIFALLRRSHRQRINRVPARVAFVDGGVGQSDLLGEPHVTSKKSSLSTAGILSAARNADGDPVIATEREAARRRLQRGMRYPGPRYEGKSIEEWMDCADAGLASIHDVRKAFYQITPEAKECVPALVRWLSHRNKHFRHVATRTLGLLGPDAATATDDLVMLLGDSDATVRGESLEALQNIGVPETMVSRIAALVLDADRFVRRSAIDALAILGEAAGEAVPELTTALKDDQSVEHAARALGSIGPGAEPAVPGLARIVADHECIEYRCAAVVALGRIGTVDALRVVERALTDSCREVRISARSVVRETRR